MANRRMAKKMEKRKEKEAVKIEIVKESEKKEEETAVNVCLQYQGKELKGQELVGRIKDWQKEHAGEESVHTLDIYVKPEDGKAYFIINGKTEGNVELFPA